MENDEAASGTDSEGERRGENVPPPLAAAWVLAGYGAGRDDDDDEVLVKSARSVLSRLHFVNVPSRCLQRRRRL